nr:5-amino-6-(D-ribitylamino)uracil--L-tyrosine 4-hydroxyphenyl transferase CofH [Sphingobium sp.]
MPLDSAMSPDDIMGFASGVETSALMAMASSIALDAFGPVVTYSPKVFIPLTRLCRDVCHYCTFATTPGRIASPYLSMGEVMEIARAGAAQGCREALFTLGDRPEDRYGAARLWLSERGHESTLAYVAAAAQAVFDGTGLLPHLNPGILSPDDYAMLRPHAASMGLMLESSADRLCERGGPHFGSPDKRPAVRLASIAAAGEAKVPFTSGILIGIGETGLERIEALCALRDLHLRYGHIQEVIVQNFRAKPGTPMAGHADAPLEELLWSIALARLILPRDVSIQAPPNLQPDALESLIAAGLNDWGGVSPVTADHVNPEAPWPHLTVLERACTRARRILRPRLAIGPRHAADPGTWLDPRLAPSVRRQVDGQGLARTDGWHAGSGLAAPVFIGGQQMSSRIAGILDRLNEGEEPDRDAVATLFTADGGDFAAVVRMADRLRREAVGDTVTHVVNRNINYTNICLYKCGFCAFSKGSTKALRGPAYRLDLPEISRRAVEAVERGATEVCLQGGIHPDYDGETYLAIVDAVRAAAPSLHIHAFSALEVFHGATTLGLPLEDYLARLKAAGLSTLPGTAAEILDPDVRAIIAPDKVTADQWLQVMCAAHGVGLRSTATIMFGHVDNYGHWANHLLQIRALQQETGGFTEFVPLPFVHMEAPFWRKGASRSGPTYREAVLMHAVARIVLHSLIPNIQVSWVKMGPDGAAAILNAGANDLGGVLMDESITRAAGGVHGQLLDQPAMMRLARSIGRPLRQRTTLYDLLPEEADPSASRQHQLERI